MEYGYQVKCYVALFEYMSYYIASITKSTLLIEALGVKFQLASHKYASYR